MQKLPYRPQDPCGNSSCCFALINSHKTLNHCQCCECVMVRTTVLLSGSQALKYNRLGRHVLIVFSCLLCTSLCCRILLGQELCRKIKFRHFATNLRFLPPAASAIPHLPVYDMLYFSCNYCGNSTILFQLESGPIYQHFADSSRCQPGETVEHSLLSTQRGA